MLGAQRISRGQFSIFGDPIGRLVERLAPGLGRFFVQGAFEVAPQGPRARNCWCFHGGSCVILKTCLVQDIDSDLGGKARAGRVFAMSWKAASAVAMAVDAGVGRRPGDRSGHDQSSLSRAAARRRPSSASSVSCGSAGSAA